MRILYLLLAFFLCRSAGAQDGNENSWYQLLDGTIGRFPVTLHLHKTGAVYYGYYCYRTQEQPIYFSGEDSTQKGVIKLHAFAPAPSDEEFTFSLQGNKAAGSWKKEANSKPLVFTATTTAPPFGFQNVYTSGLLKLRPDAGDSPEATYEAAAVWPTGTAKAYQYLQAAIRKFFVPDDTGTGAIGNLLLQEKNKFFASYQADTKDATDAEIKEAPPLFNRYELHRLAVAHQSPGLLTLAFISYSYTGGAHGNHGTVFSTYSVAQNKKLEIAGVLNPSGRKQLGPLLEKYFRKAHGLGVTDSLQKAGLFENRILPNENFYLTPRGIGFNYTPYEIGPYALGEITVFIPLHELEAYLQPDLKALLQKSRRGEWLE